jgi:hypothetical protein
MSINGKVALVTGAGPQARLLGEALEELYRLKRLADAGQE